MAYKGTKVMGSVMANKEINFLNQGFNYFEIATFLGTKPKTIAERNRSLYHIDIYKAFKEKIGREGIPNNLKISDEFGYYFTGLFDGEGCLVLYLRHRKINNKFFPDSRMGVQICLRYDDINVLEYIKENLGGNIYNRSPVGTKDRPSYTWKLEKIKDITEKILPLFDKYPLRTKKCREYKIWRPLATRRYVASMGGHVNRMRIDPTLESDMRQAIHLIGSIRHPSDCY